MSVNADCSHFEIARISHFGADSVPQAGAHHVSIKKLIKACLTF